MIRKQKTGLNEETVITLDTFIKTNNFKIKRREKKSSLWQFGIKSLKTISGVAFFL